MYALFRNGKRIFSSWRKGSVWNKAFYIGALNWRGCPLSLKQGYTIEEVTEREQSDDKQQ